MAAIALVNPSGKYNMRGEIEFSWGYPPGAPDTIHVYPIKMQGGRRVADTGQHNFFTLAKNKHGAVITANVESTVDVSLCRYLLYLSSQDERNIDLTSIVNDKTFVITVTVGNANISYSMKTKHVESGMDRHKITVVSQAVIAKGILGYTFWQGGQRFSVSLPTEIQRGKNEFPAFFTPLGTAVNLEVVRGTSSNVTIKRQEKKITFFN